MLLPTALYDAVLTHHTSDGIEQPIGFVSCSLTKAEKAYSQIEKETLSCIFGINRFHTYLYGYRFTLITDHKLLLSLYQLDEGPFTAQQVKYYTARDPCLSQVLTLYKMAGQIE